MGSTVTSVTRKRLTTQERDRKREQSRLAQCRHRARQRNGERVYPVRAGETVHEALIARSIDAGLSAGAAERDACNRNKISADLADIIVEWARRYLNERTRNA